jgi:hypothetical protein
MTLGSKENYIKAATTKREMSFHRLEKDYIKAPELTKSSAASQA